MRPARFGFPAAANADRRAGGRGAGSLQAKQAQKGEAGQPPSAWFHLDAHLRHTRFTKDRPSSESTIAMDGMRMACSNL